MKLPLLLTCALLSAALCEEPSIIPIRVIKRPLRASDRFGVLTCNHDIKKSFTARSLDFFDEQMTKATVEMNEICPNVVGSCCSAREMAQFLSEGSSYIELVEIYLNSVQQFYKTVQNFNTTRFLENFRDIRNRPGTCISSDFRPEIELDILNLNFLAKKSIEQSKLLYRTVYQYYMGFMCSMCNVRQQESFRVTNNVELTIEVDTAMCEGMMTMRQLQLELGRTMLRFYDVAKEISCLYVDKFLDEAVIKHIREKNKSRLNENKKCLNPGRSFTDTMLKEDCQKLCKRMFHIRKFTIMLDLLTLAKLVGKVLNSFANERFSFDKKTRELFEADIENNNSKDMFRRVWDMWPPTIKNIYTANEYNLTFSYRGLNFYNNNVKLNTRSYYTDSRYLQHQLGATVLRAIGVAALSIFWWLI